VRNIGSEKNYLGEYLTNFWRDGSAKPSG